MTKKTSSSKKISVDPTKMREQDGENQNQFWGRHGVTQSGGSRYESGRNIPRPVRMLMALSSGQATIEQLKSGELAGLV